MKIQHQKILDSVLCFIPREGWTSAAFVCGVKKAGISEVEAHKFFPAGIDDIVTAFARMIDDAMWARIKAKRNYSTLRVRDKVIFAVRVRLEAIESHLEAMRRLILWGLLPRNIRKSGQQVWRVADAIWIAAGDSSTDYNFYTKRLLLIAVMKSTLSFWLNDDSAGHSESWAFLDRRINDIMKLGKGVGVVRVVGVSDIVSFVQARFAA